MTTILIDLQACQTESRYRGLGRYAMNMARELAIAAPGRVHLLLNSAFPHSVLELRQYFGAFVADHDIHVVQMLRRANDSEPHRRWRNDASALLREAYIAMIAPDVVFCPSYFEGYVDDAVLSLNCISDVPVVVAKHDLIPLTMPERYIAPYPDYGRHYRAKIEEVKTAAGLIAISHHALTEAVDVLGADASRVINASEGADSQFRPLGLTEAQKQQRRSGLGLQQRFVLYTGGSDPRKNLGRLIDAFASLSPAVRGDVQLVMAGSMPAADVDGLMQKARQARLGPDQFKLLGFVTDEQLVELFNLCEAFVFPSLHEGFGLPCLEAMQCGAATIGANTTSVPEVIGNPAALFDPHSVSAIANKLEQVLVDPQFRQELIAHGREQAKRFSWAKSGRLALEFLERCSAPKTPRGPWGMQRERLDTIEARLIDAVVRRSGQHGNPSAVDLADFSQALATNRVAAENLLRPISLPHGLQWRIEGPYDSSYSLALVNRELARALERRGDACVALHSSEGPGDFAPSPSFLAANPDLALLAARAGQQPAETACLTTRNMYPPRVLDMTGAVNGLHNYAWEETGFPFHYAEAFNECLQVLTVTSQHVKKLLVEAGVSIPISVVGNGVDHWQTIEADRNFTIERAGHTFLHVSSCFPRKGADVLLKSYGAAFTKNDDVLLVIKTFANPHNTIAQQLATLQAARPDFPKVLLLMEDLSDGALKALYEQCDTLVAPSRAEGFGLPLAEALLSGLRVITTGWSGQLEFCNASNAALIDYSFAPASTHEPGKPLSAWAEPDGAHLTQLLREAAQAGRSNADPGLLPHWSWDAVAARSVAAVTGIDRRKLTAEPRIGWITTFRKRCGIATYSEHLLDVLGLPSIILANTQEADPREPGHVVRCWDEGEADPLDRVAAAIARHELDTIVIQFNYGFFDFGHLRALLHRLCDEGRRVVVTLHASIDPPGRDDRRLALLVDALRRCDRLLVHSIQDMNRLKGHGLVDNVALFPHGVLMPPEADGPAPRWPRGRPVRLASYGFFLPNKGLLELIEAANILHQQKFSFRLDMINAAYPAEISERLILQAKALIKHYRLEGHVRMITDFLPDQESLERLAHAEIIVYPYQSTSESASGAVRYGLAAGKAVAVTPLPIFDDVADITFALPGTEPAQLAAGLVALAGKLRRGDAQTEQMLQRGRDWRNVHAYPVLGRRLAGMLRGLYRDALPPKSSEPA